MPSRLTFACRAMLSAVLAALVGGGSAAADESPRFHQVGPAFLKKYCVDCHGASDPEAELSLAAFRDDASVVKERKTWDTLLKLVQTGQMPPPEAERPTVDEIQSLVAAVKATLADADRSGPPVVGRVTVRRLNRTEYNNTIRDLVGVDFNPAEDFPSDDIGHGFDNIGDVLTVSPVLMERYLAASESIVERAIVPNPPPPPKRRLVSRYTQPASANVPLKGNFRYIWTEATGGSVETGPVFTDYKMDPEGEYIFRTKVYAEIEGKLEPLKEKEPSGAGSDLLEELEGKGKKPEGGRKVYAAVLACGPQIENGASDEEAARIWGKSVPPLRPFVILKTLEITARDAAGAEEIEVKVPPMPGITKMAIGLLDVDPSEPPVKLYVEYLGLDGPLDTRPSSHRRILAVDAGKPQAEQTRDVLRRFASKAYRRPATADEVERLAALAEALIDEGASWEAALQRAIQAVLVSPKFLFRLELDDRPQDDAPLPLDEYQLASRMSYFLWSSLPDDELFELAGAGQLTANLEAQVRRMLQDPKAEALVENFALQWLQLQRLTTYEPDPELFPAFTDKLRTAMLTETQLFFQEIMREDRSILDLLSADYTYLNEPLARHYGIVDNLGNLAGEKAEKKGQPIRGDQFQRVALSDGRRGGLLTQASVLTVTSNPTRTSPVKRGRWVLEQILGTPPPPPPPDVPELEEGDQAALSGSLRQRMEQHMRVASCAACHARMDPIGFAFENYDAIGAWREKDGEFPIESEGTLPDGKTFQDAVELRAILLEQRELFARSLVEKMLTYALGRGLEYYDRAAIDRIGENLSDADYRFSSLVVEIVRSDPFRLRPAKEPTP